MTSTHKTETELVEITLPAGADCVVIARFAVAAIGARAGFDIDEIEDLRLAIDELCISFEPPADGGHVRLQLERAGDLVRVMGSTESDQSNATSDLAWKRSIGLSTQLLDALVDEHGREAVGPLRWTWFVKRCQKVR
jgi:hypothetical protein